MKRRLVLTAAVLACVGITLGAAVKIRSFETFDPEPLDADGMAILNYAAGNDKTIVQIIISDFTPNTTYGLRLTDGTMHLDALDAITTDQHGNGTFHTTVFFDRSAFDVELYVDEDGDLNFQPEELRAVGDNPAS